MPKQRRNAPKAPNKPSTTTPNGPSPSTPPPFIPAPSTLEPFLKTLSAHHIYILSLDTHPRDFKRRIFAVPLLLNIFLTILILYRLQYAIPTYISILLAALGFETSMKIDVKNLDAMTKLGLGGERTLMFLGDFLLMRFVGMWPWGFFLGFKGEASPVGWRRWVGFRDVEVVVRRSRRWDVSLFTEICKEDGGEVVRGEVKESFLEEGKEGRVWKERVGPAVERGWIKGKTSYLMMDKSWDLFFTGMLKAHALIDEGVMGVESFRTAVLVHSESLGWLIWEVWREHDDGEVNENQGTKKLQLIKDKLTKMGKENLFFRWIEVVQSETSQPGAFTAEKQKKAVGNIREEFEEKGVDFDQFWGDVDGGIESMPGLEITG